MVPLRRGVRSVASVWVNPYGGELVSTVTTGPKAVMPNDAHDASIAGKKNSSSCARPQYRADGVTWVNTQLVAASVTAEIITTRSTTLYLAIITALAPPCECPPTAIFDHFGAPSARNSAHPPVGSLASRYWSTFVSRLMMLFGWFTSTMGLSIPSPLPYTISKCASSKQEFGSGLPSHATRKLTLFTYMRPTTWYPRRAASCWTSCISVGIVSNPGRSTINLWLVGAVGSSQARWSSSARSIAGSVACGATTWRTNSP